MSPSSVKTLNVKHKVYFCSLRAFFILKCTIKYINRETLKLHLRNNNFIHKKEDFPHLHPHSVRDSNSHGHNWPLDPRYYEDV